MNAADTATQAVRPELHGDAPVMRPETATGGHGARRRFSQRPCPRCDRETLQRIPLVAYLRPLRRIGLDYGRYLCASCGTSSIIRRV